jgi:hypothetical protein
MSLANTMINGVNTPSASPSGNSALQPDSSERSTQGGATSELTNPNRIEGYVYLKRKLDWVKRYATVENCLFSYKKQMGDKQARNTLDLRRATIKYTAS